MTTFAEELTGQLTPLKENAVKYHALQSEANVIKPQPTDTIMGAVREISDISERMLTRLIILGELARSIRDNVDTLNANHLEVGMFKSELTPEVKSLFKTWGFEETKYGYKFYYTPPTKWDIKFPVEIHVIKKHYKFFDHLDSGFFGVDNFLIPNPFESYWRIRHLIK